VCAKEAKNLENQARQEVAQREGTEQALDAKGKIIEFLWHLERENKSSKTIVSYRKYITRLFDIVANLFDPESVKDAIAKQKSWAENSKRMATEVYKSFAASNNMQFKPPKYKVRPKLPFIPLESELDTLIAGSNKRLAACLQLLKEAPIRIGEALTLKWTEIDCERRIIYVHTVEKDGKPRARSGTGKPPWNTTEPETSSTS
jgi:integrase